MRIIITGGDGYIGWPAAMNLALDGHEVVIIDNYLRRQLMSESGTGTLHDVPELSVRVKDFRNITGKDLEVEIGDLTNAAFTSRLVGRLKPDVIIHCAEQPSPAYSMKGRNEAQLVFKNNTQTTLNLVLSVLQHAPDCHFLKMGSIGEYGTPNADIEEGWLSFGQGDKTQKTLFPRDGATLYHISKSVSTQLLWFYVQQYGLRASNLMQGTVYGLQTADILDHESLRPNFYYDYIFGNVVNRFMSQAISNVPLTIYGEGEQLRSYHHLHDVINCLRTAIATPPRKGTLSIKNQFSDMLTVNDIADRIQLAASSLGFSVMTSRSPGTDYDDDGTKYVVKKSEDDAVISAPQKKMTRELLKAEMEIVTRHADKIDRDKLLLQHSS